MLLNGHSLCSGLYHQWHHLKIIIYKTYFASFVIPIWTCYSQNSQFKSWMSEAMPVTGEMDSSEVCCFLCSSHLKHTKGQLSFYEDTLLKETFGSNNLGFWGREKHEALPFLPHAYAPIDNGRNSQLRPPKEKWSSLHNAASLFADKRVRSTRSEQQTKKSEIISPHVASVRLNTTITAHTYTRTAAGAPHGAHPGRPRCLAGRCRCGGALT